MICHECEQKITGTIRTRTLATCHPAITYYTIKVCEDCYNK